MEANLDERKCFILRTIIEEYIKTGEPVGSKHIATATQMSVSSATIRNEMALLEKMGLLEQPHTSAGRIPTFVAYRIYIEHLMQPQQLNPSRTHEIDKMLQEASVTAQNLLEQAVDMLSDVTELMVLGVGQTVQFSLITRVEVIPAGKRLYALMLMTSSGAIKNKVCRLEFSLTNEQIHYFSEVVNKYLQGVTVEELTPTLLENLSIALGSYLICLSPLLEAVFKMGEEISLNQLHIRGKERLFVANEVDHKQLEAMMHSKEKLSHLLQDSLSDIKVLFGDENKMFAVSNASMILAPYHINQAQGGMFSVLGPLRIDYAKVIPYMQHFSTQVSKMLAECIEHEETTLNEDLERNDTKQ